MAKEGWRTYDTTPGGLLVGGYSKEWPTSYMQAECPRRYVWVYEHPTGPVEVTKVPHTPLANAEAHLLDPARNCNCGIYCHLNPEQLFWYSLGRVTAKVQAWGAISPYSEGFRAQHVQITHLYVRMRELADLLQQQYPDIEIVTPSIFRKIREFIFAIE